MARRFKLAIVRARNDSSVATISDQACRQMLMTGPQSVLRYWADTTGGWLDFVDSAMMPWIDINVTAADMGRNAQAQLAFAALRAANPGFDPLAGFDGALVITHPGQMTIPNPMASTPGQPPTIVAGFDGGSSVVGNLRTSVIPVLPSDHTFMCHELGHTLGFDHSFGLDNNGTDWNPGDATIIIGQEYGSPYDLMSSAAFGSRWLGTGPFWTANPTFIGDTVQGWPTPGAFSMGPNMSRANLHLWFPDSLDQTQAEHRNFPTGGVSRARLSATSTNGRTLLVLHPPGEPSNGVGRVYIEYRDRAGWDLGLDVFGDDLAREGVVVHTVENTAAGVRIWYRGSIVTGAIDTDLKVAGRNLLITLDDFDGSSAHGSKWAEISCRETGATSVTIREENREEIVLGGNPIRDDTTPCGENITWGAWAVATSCQYEISTTGFGGEAASLPVVTWTVAGTVLTGNNGQVPVPFDEVSFTLDYSIDPVSYELPLSTAAGGERYDANVVATANLGAQTATASTVFKSRGYYEGYPPEDEAILNECLATIVDRGNIRHQGPRFRRPGPDPWPDFDVEGWRDRALERARDLNLHPTTAQALETIVLLQAPARQVPATGTRPGVR